MFGSRGIGTRVSMEKRLRRRYSAPRSGTGPVAQPVFKTGEAS